MKKLPNEAITHSGRFHADDVFSTALLKILNPQIKVNRVNNITENYKGLVFDLIGGEYDHHNDKQKIRENGVAYASFGLLWNEYGKYLVAEEDVKTFDESFVQPLDIQDNCGGNNMLARAITQANPKWNSNNNPDECFFKAVEFAEFILQNEIDSMKSTQAAKKVVLNSLSNSKNGIVVLPVGAPWKGLLIPEAVYFVVYPSGRGGFNAQTVPKSFKTNEPKISFPDEWKGKMNEELRSISGIDSIIFCHSGGYLLSAESENDAIKACQVALASLGMLST